MTETEQQYQACINDVERKLRKEISAEKNKINTEVKQDEATRQAGCTNKAEIISLLRETKYYEKI